MTGQARTLALFDALLALPDGERAEFLTRECGDDSRLRAELQALLDADAAAAGFLDAPLVPAAQPRPDERIGPYRLLRELGQGGMGRVFLAERADALYSRQVAIKFLRHDLGDLRERFGNERRILAALDHPNIAKLIDAGNSASDAPYVVMEYVEGEPITRHCERTHASQRERIALFLQVLDAVQHAHAHLIVHRDLKPENILVGADGLPKLLDFGIAKLLEPEVRGLTQTGLAPMTPEYASPEQVRGESVGTASDVYSLGVLLYQLLTGERPYAISTRSPAEIERTVCLVEPARPSKVARARSGARIDRDLDHIVLKALNKEASGRYLSCQQFADDLRRYLDGRPVLARATPRREVALKFLRRNRLAASAAAAIVLALVVGTGLALVQARRANEQAQIARSERDRAERVSEFLTSMLAAADPATGGREVTVVSLLDAAARGFEHDQGNDPELTAAIQRTLAQSYRALGLLDPALDEALAAYNRASKAPASATARAASALVLGQIHIERGEAELALPLLVEARAVYAAAADAALELAAADNLLGELHSQAGRYDIAEGHYADAIARLRAQAPANDPRLAELLDNLAVTRGRAGKLADAEALHSEALAIFRAARGEQHPHTAHALFNLANVREMRDDFAGADGAFRQAEAIQRAALGDTHPDLAQTLASHTFMLNRAGRHAEAVQRGREAVAAASALTPPNPISAYAHAMYGESLLIDGQPAVAVAELRDALSQRERMLPDDHPVRLNGESLLGAALAASGDTDEGQRRLRHALERLLATLGPEHEFTRRAQARVERYSPR